MNLINSCQAVAHSFLVNQPYQWYFWALTGLIFVKILSTFFKSRDVNYSLAIKLPRIATRIFEQHHFPLSQVRLLMADEPLAFTSGWLTPKISFSQALINQLTVKQLEAVILHEIYHARHYHPAQVAFSKIIISVFAILPVFDDLAHYYWLVLETQADYFAQTQQQSNRYLRGALAKMLTSPTPDFALGFAHHSLDQRVHCLLTNSQPWPKIYPLKVIISVLVVLGLFWYSQRWQSALALENQYHVSAQCAFAQCVSNCVSETLSSPAPVLSPDIRYSPVK